MNKLLTGVTFAYEVYENRAASFSGSVFTQLAYLMRLYSSLPNVLTATSVSVAFR